MKEHFFSWVCAEYSSEKLLKLYWTGQHWGCENPPGRRCSARPDTEQWNVTVGLELGLALLPEAAECTSALLRWDTTTHSEFRVAEVSRIERRL